MEIFGDSLRLNVASEGIRVATIEPGAVRTERLEHIPDEELTAGVEEYDGSMETPPPRRHRGLWEKSLRGVSETASIVGAMSPE